MIIIVGGEPELSCGMARRGMAKREGGVCARPYALRRHKSCPECGVHVSRVLPLVASVSPLISCDCLVPYVSAVSSLVAPVSLRFSDGCVAPWHAGV